MSCGRAGLGVETNGDYHKIDDPALEDADEVASAFGAHLVNSLTAQEATRRLLAAGANEHRAVTHYQDPLIYLLQAAIAIALTGRVAYGVDRRQRPLIAFAA